MKNPQYLKSKRRNLFLLGSKKDLGVFSLFWDANKPSFGFDFWVWSVPATTRCLFFSSGTSQRRACAEAVEEEATATAGGVSLGFSIRVGGGGPLEN